MDRRGRMGSKFTRFDCFVVSYSLATLCWFQGWSRIGDPILHIEVRSIQVVSRTRDLQSRFVPQLRRWADLVLIAPCSANTLAKLTHGICDNVIVCILPFSLPLLVAERSLASLDFTPSSASSTRSSHPLPSDEHSHVLSSTNIEATQVRQGRIGISSRGTDPEKTRLWRYR